MGEFKMPSLGADMESGTLTVWRVKPGDRVKRGSILAEIEVDKGLVEVESFEDGVVEQLLVEPGSRVPVGTVLAVFREADSEAPEPKPEPRHEERLRISPLARKLAAELGVDPSAVQGRGPGGAIERADIELAAAAKHPQPGAQPVPTAPPIPRPTLREPSYSGSGAPEPPAIGAPSAPNLHDRARGVLAAVATRSHREIPHYYVSTRIDLSRALRWMEQENLRQPMSEALFPGALLLRAVALTLTEIPELNGSWIEERHEIHQAVHAGLVISLPGGGLVVASIHDAHLKNVHELASDLRTLIPRARSGHLRSSEMRPPTITIIGLADPGAETVFGLIYPPQLALVGLGGISDRPWAENGMIGVRPILNATLSGDHRATDSHRGAQFLETLNRHLQQPEQF